MTENVSVEQKFAEFEEAGYKLGEMLLKFESFFKKEIRPLIEKTIDGFNDSQNTFIIGDHIVSYQTDNSKQKYGVAVAVMRIKSKDVKIKGRYLSPTEIDDKKSIILEYLLHNLAGISEWIILVHMDSDIYLEQAKG